MASFISGYYRTVDLSHFIRSYDGELDAPLCAQLVQSFEAATSAHQRNGADRRAGLADSAWTELDVGAQADAAFLGFFRTRINRALARYNADIGLTPLPVPNSPRTSELILKRYRPGGEERFQPHFDSVNAVSDRYLVFLWYLNDVSEGGETEFAQLGLRIAPKAGRLLMFPPYWMYQHAGLPPRSGDKYILSTYLLFPKS
ncbi:MAG: 2OG-Fe(II) oxygenase [Steroidobacteraceae bacterium]